MIKKRGRPLGVKTSAGFANSDFTLVMNIELTIKQLGPWKNKSGQVRYQWIAFDSLSIVFRGKWARVTV